MSPSPFDPHGTISRRDLTLDRRLWLTYSAVFAIVAIGTAGIAVMWPSSFSGARLYPFAALLAVVSLMAGLTRPFKISNWRNHVAVLLVPICTSLGIIAYAPSGAVPVAAAMFVGTVTAARLEGRRELAIHFVLATLLLIAPLLVVHVDRSTELALISMIPATLMLGACCVLIIEAAESQSEELAKIVRRDPLTGAGNRRMLSETLAKELPQHLRAHRPLSLVTMDLNGFKQLNDSLGHDAGDALLRHVATVLGEGVGADDVVVRQGGDEFCLILPNTSSSAARDLAETLSDALANPPAGAAAVSTGIGIATCPSDGVDGDFLLEVADTRLAADKAARSGAARAGLTPVVPITPRLFEAPEPAEEFVLPQVPAVVETKAPEFIRLSRHEIAVSQLIWRAIGSMMTLYAVLFAGCFLLSSHHGPVAIGYVVCLGIVAAVALRSQPPALRSWLNHLVIAAPYVFSTALAFAIPDFAGVMIGALAFTGPQTAIRLVDRRFVVAHYLAATVLICVVMAVANLGLAFNLGLALMMIVIWGLGFGTVVFLESAEAQGDELERLVRRDPLTGVGNRRLLDELLDHELRRHARTRKSFTVLALDLNGFKAINDSVGHAAGDGLLRAVATRLVAVTRPDDAVVRQGGDEFCVLLPDTDAADALPIANAIRMTIAGLSTPDHPVGTGVGMATFPSEAKTAEVLMHVADERLMLDKQLSSTMRRRKRTSPMTVVRTRQHRAS